MNIYFLLILLAADASPADSNTWRCAVIDGTRAVKYGLFVETHSRQDDEIGKDFVIDTSSGEITGEIFQVSGDNSSIFRQGNDTIVLVSTLRDEQGVHKDVQYLRMKPAGPESLNFVAATADGLWTGLCQPND